MVQLTKKNNLLENTLPRGLKKESMLHELKTWKQYFAMVFCGSKTFEVRLNDRDYKLGDELLLKEWCPEKKEYTGRILHRRVDYILYGGAFGIEPEFCVMSITKV